MFKTRVRRRYLILSSGITWVKPDFQAELGEYFENDFTKDWLEKQGIVWKDEKELCSVLETGKLTPIDLQDAAKEFECVNMSVGEDINQWDSEYRESYDSMQKAVEQGATLPAPILLKLKNVLFGFAGNRRENLAYQNDLPLQVWMVDLNRGV